MAKSWVFARSIRMRMASQTCRSDWCETVSIDRVRDFYLLHLLVPMKTSGRKGSCTAFTNDMDALDIHAFNTIKIL